MKFFCFIYLHLVEWLARCLLFFLNPVMRHLVVLKGKNPDCVVPPSPPPSFQDALTSPAPFIDHSRIPLRASNYPGANVFVKDLSKHPIIQSRLAYEERQRAKSPEPKTSSPTDFSSDSQDHVSEYERPLDDQAIDDALQILAKYAVMLRYPPKPLSSDPEAPTPNDKFRGSFRRAKDGQ